MSLRGNSNRRPTIAPPPGQGRTTATYQANWFSSVLVTGLMAVVVLLFGFFRGIRDPRELSIAALVCAIPLGWLVSRTQVAAGPGWLSHRNMLGRRRWLRTDRVVVVKEFDRFTSIMLTLRDEDGRKVSVDSVELAEEPRLLAQVQADVRTAMGRGLQLSDRARRSLQLDNTGPSYTKRKRKR